MSSRLLNVLLHKKGNNKMRQKWLRWIGLFGCLFIMIKFIFFIFALLSRLKSFCATSSTYSQIKHYNITLTSNLSDLPCTISDLEFISITMNTPGSTATIQMWASLRLALGAALLITYFSYFVIYWFSHFKKA
jgi:hypothetical protein